MTFSPTAEADGGGAVAIGSGILAGLLTLTFISGMVWFLGRDTGGPETGSQERPTTPIPAGELMVNDCVQIGGSAASVTVFTPTDCATEHDAEVVARLVHPDASSTYPGQDALMDWADGRCSSEAESYVGDDLRSTSLDSVTRLPSFDDWADGDTSITCFVEAIDGSTLAAAAAGGAGAFPRGEEVRVSRLRPGDCFEPIGTDPVEELTSENQVRVVDCGGTYNGIFFARGRLSDPPGAPFPDDEEVGQAANSLCAGRFAEFFGVPADGFNYRYWRPNEIGWLADDRVVLCSILEAEPLEGLFTAETFQAFFDVEPGGCFNLGPGETPSSLRLDDQVLPIDCETPHIGQMLGSGQLEGEDGGPFPGDEEVRSLAGQECQRLFVDFIGALPTETEFGEFPFWFPTETGWDDGDRRYGCAFLENADDLRTGSLAETIPES